MLRVAVALTSLRCRYFNETGSNCPSILPHDQQKALCDLAVAAAKCLGFQMGVLHTELKFTSHGPQLIEVTPQMDLQLHAGFPTAREQM